MKKYLWLILILSGFSLAYKAIAYEDDITKPINSSFVGDISNSMADEFWGKEDLPKKTDSAFVGTDILKDDDSLFAGGDFDKLVKEQTDTAFAGNHTFAGDDYGK